MIQLLALISALYLSIRGVACEISLSAEEYGKAINQSLLWAPYRSNCYFGIRPRYVQEEPFIMGMMWFDAANPRGIQSMRHFVDQGDNLDKYNWIWYDPRIGGKETIVDFTNNLELNFTFVKSHSGENWVVQVEGDRLDEDRITAQSLVLYMKQNEADEGSYSFLTRDLKQQSSKKDLRFSGSSKQLGNYQLNIDYINSEFFRNKRPPLTPDCDPSAPSVLSMNVPSDQVWKAKDVFQTIIMDSIQDHFETNPNMGPDSIVSALTIRNIHNFPSGSMNYVQQTFDGHFKFNIIYNKRGSRDQIESNSVEHLIASAQDAVQKKFDSTFELSRTSKYKQFAQETFSNLLGGLAYFHGTHFVDRETVLDEESFAKIELTKAKEEGPYELFSMVPSRAFFPRGFYWDEGFHLMQLLDYDSDLVFEIVHSWLNLMDEEGWIPREVILGNEARSKVPEEFRVQNHNIANPPTILLAFSELLNRAKTMPESILEEHVKPNYLEESYGNLDDGSVLNRNPHLLIAYAQDIYPDLLKHYQWFRRTQQGIIEEYLDDAALQDKVHQNEVYRWVGRTFTHCLPSGMDDYPRAIPPDIAELHVDALTWVGVMTRSMRMIATVLELEDDIQRFARIEKSIVENLSALHWSDEDKMFCDVTLNDEAMEDESLRRFVCHEGYVSLLPFAVKLIPPENVDQLKNLLESMSNTSTLLSPFGLRSLSKQDEFYNTGEAYWRGPIWININYLCLDALKFYFTESTLKEHEAQHQELFALGKNLYKDLRESIIENVYSIWKKDGYVYEQYNHKTGKGQGVKHFTGWTALLVNMIGALPKEL